MLKNILLYIFIIFIIAEVVYSQNNPSKIAFIDSTATADSLTMNVSQDTIIHVTDDTVKILKTNSLVHDTLKQVEDIPDKIEQTLLENLQLNPFNIIESIDFWTFLQLFIWIFIGTALVKLINKTSKSKFIINRFPFFSSILSLLRISVWFGVFYIILFWVLNVPQNILWILMLIIFIILGVSTVPFFKNIVGGFYISLSSPFEVGNNIVINGFEGQVIEVSWRSVKILTEEGNEIDLPNSIFLTNPVVNINFGEKERLIVLEYSLPFQYESAAILKLLKEAALSSPYIFNEIEPKVFLIKSDFIQNINLYELNVYIIDIKFENEFKSLFNNMILTSLKKKDNE